MSRRRVLAIAVCFVASACSRVTRSSPSGTVAEASVGDAALPLLEPDTGARLATDGSEPSTESSRHLVSAKSIGHTSLVFKMRWASEGTRTVAFKPASRKGGTRYRSEVAAYALAAELHCEQHVTPATIRAVPVAELASAFGDRWSEITDLLPKPLPSFVYGAEIPWVEKLEFLPLEKPEWRERWKGWLTTRPPSAPVEQRLALAISTMIVFDALTGNWDRWSGGNVGFVRAAGSATALDGELLFVDNDAAFFEPLSDKLYDAPQRALRSIRAYPKRLLEELRAFRPERFRERLRLHEGPEKAPLLSEPQLRALDARVRKVVAELDDALRHDGYLLDENGVAVR